MELIIDIPEKTVNKIKDNAMFAGSISSEILWDVTSAIVNGTPLDKHDEEVIADTVESIWGKPPYIDMLDKIRAEIDKQEKWLLQAGYTAYNVDIALDAIKSVVTERSEE